MIVIINGVSECGKDTFIKNIVHEGFTVKNISTIDFIREKMQIFNVKGKSEKERKVLNGVKKLLIEYNDFPFLNTSFDVKEAEGYDYDFIFVHCREAMEIEKLKIFFSASTLLIQPCGDWKPQPCVGDEEVYNVEYDYIVYNSGRELDFKLRTREFLKDIGKIV